MLECQPWYFDSGSAASPAATAKKQFAFPYFDNYNVVTGSFPTVDSKSLLFFNESAVYGEVPTDSLYTDYWETYVELLYNPRTRLLNASAIIPLADYFKMELNDIVQFRGNYYHLRAINDYNLKNGECSIQLLGPILSDALPFAQPAVPTTTTTSTTSTTTTSTTTSTSTTSTTTEQPFNNGPLFFGLSLSLINFKHKACRSSLFVFTFWTRWGLLTVLALTCCPAGLPPC